MISQLQLLEGVKIVYTISVYQLNPKNHSKLQF